MTTNELLQAEGKELSRLLGEVLQSEHSYQHTFHAGPICNKCGNVKRNSNSEFCPVSFDDWNVAGKWWRWAIDTYGCEAFEQAVAKLDASKRRYPFDPSDPDKLDAAISNIMLQASPINFLLIAAICKENNA